MRNRKVLLVSPTPTHLTNAGNRARILAFVELLRERGYDVYFLLLVYESFDRTSLEAYWGDRIIYFNREQIYPDLSIYSRVINKLLRKKNDLVKWFWYKGGEYNKEDVRYNSFIDDHYPTSLGPVLLRLRQLHRFSCVWVEYVFLSKALSAFGKDVVKVLDTHDVFSDRYKRYLEVNHTPEWFSFFRSEEAKGFNRADVVIAIQPAEVQAIQQLSDTRVLQIGHLIRYQPLQQRAFTGNLLYVASDHRFNLDGINHFLKAVYPKVISQFPAVKLLIAGSIARVQDKLVYSSHVEMVGEVDVIEKAYLMGDIVICPVRSGTGLKIKLVEGLAFGKPCAATARAAEGLEEFAGQYFISAASDDEFAEELVDLLKNEGKREALSKKTKEFCTKYNNRSQLAELFESLEKYSG